MLAFQATPHPSQSAFGDPASSRCMLYAVLNACCCLQGASATHFRDTRVISPSSSTYGPASNTAGGSLSAVRTIQTYESHHYQHQLRRHPIASTIFDQSQGCHLQHTLDKPAPDKAQQPCGMKFSALQLYTPGCHLKTFLERFNP